MPRNWYARYRETARQDVGEYLEGSLATITQRPWEPWHVRFGCCGEEWIAATREQLVELANAHVCEFPQALAGRATFARELSNPMADAEADMWRCIGEVLRA